MKMFEKCYFRKSSTKKNQKVRKKFVRKEDFGQSLNDVTEKASGVSVVVVALDLGSEYRGFLNPSVARIREDDDFIEV
jgi:hypothetical protein